MSTGSLTSIRLPLSAPVTACRVEFAYNCYNHQVAKHPGIYIHIPFCEKKCTYCSFNTTDFVEALAGRYVEAVANEITYWGEMLALEQEAMAAGRVAIDTIYFGGGTPSIVEAGQLASLIEACRRAFDVARSVEITIEINPNTVVSAGESSATEIRKFDDWREAGINRASVGVQSFIDRELKALSRTHTSVDALGTVEALREAGFQNISLDLIAGLPEQTLEDWEFNLNQALRVRPEHLSLYLLEVKEGTQLQAQIKRGLRAMPDDDLAADMYRMICDVTEAAGYDHYEISNFAILTCSRSRNSSFRSKHNMKYWTGAPFYGMGCGAHSYDGRARWVNVRRTEDYIDHVLSSGSAIAERRELTPADRATEALFMGLRLTGGINIREFCDRYGLDVGKRYKGELERLAQAGLIEIDEGQLRLTRAGLLLSNEVFVAFV